MSHKGHRELLGFDCVSAHDKSYKDVAGIVEGPVPLVESTDTGSIVRV